MSKKFLSPIKLAQGATNPAVGSEGELFWNTVDLKVYVHNGTSWAASGGAFTMSPTAPTSPEPKHGDPWLDTSDGSLYVRYVDADGTGQWIQIQTTSAINSELVNRAEALETDVAVLQAQTSGFEADVISLDSRTDSLESRATAVEGRATVLEARNMSYNYIINGAFDIWQRGTSVPHAGGGLVVDRWRQYTDTGSGTNSRQTSFITGVGQYCHRFTSTAASTNYSLFQYIETSNAINMAGKTVTLSSYLRASTSMSIKLEVSYSTTVDAGWGVGTFTVAGTNTVAVTTTGARYSVTVVIPSNAVSISVGLSSPTNLVNGQWVEEAGVQLEEGAGVTPFRRNAPSLHAELASCYRYYQRFTAFDTNGSYFTPGYGQAQSSTTAHFQVPMMAAMRKLPTLSYSAVGDWGAHRPGQTITVATALSTTSGQTTQNMSYVLMTFSSDGNYGSNVPCMLSARGNAAAWLAFDAEL